MAHGLTGQEDSKAHLERIMRLFADPVQCRGGASHAVGGSVGVAHSTPDDAVDDLFRRADAAMYKAKRSAEVMSAYRMA